MKKQARRVRGTLPGRLHKVGAGGLGVRSFARWYRTESLRQWRDLDFDALESAAAAVEKAAGQGRHIYVIGNGGSAATAAHAACDLSKTAARRDRAPIRCLSLADNMPLVTAIANDLSFDETFSLPLRGLLDPGDVVILISGSGNSPNLIRAAATAKSQGARTIALLGFDGGKLRGRVDIPVMVHCDQYGVVEDMHMSMIHILTFYLRQRGPCRNRF